MVSKCYSAIPAFYSYDSSDSMLNCGLHPCPQLCHQLSDHSKVLCEYILDDKCPKGHERSWKCHNPPRGCSKCEAEARRAQKEAQNALKEKEKRAREEQEHIENMARINAMIAEERQRLRDAQLSRDRAVAVHQKERDLADAKTMTLPPLDLLSNAHNGIEGSSKKGSNPMPPQAPSTLWENYAIQTTNSVNSTAPKWTNRRHSPAKEEWERQKTMENARNQAIDSVMDMIGQEEIKLQILQIKAKIEISMRQNADMSSDRLNVSFLGNPGTGKTSQSAAHFRQHSVTNDGACQGKQQLLVCMPKSWRPLEPFRAVLSKKPLAHGSLMMVLLALKRYWKAFSVQAEALFSWTKPINSRKNTTRMLDDRS